MRGEAFHRIIIQLKGFRINPDTWEVEQGNETYSRMENFTGARWIGIPPFYRIHRYHFRWAIIDRQKQDDGTTKAVPQHREEKNLDMILVSQAVYYGMIESAETKEENLPVDIGFLITLRIVDPRKALFMVHRWLDAVLDLVAQRGRQYIGTRKYFELVSEEGKEQDKGFSGGIKELKDHMRDNFGVEFVYADIYSVAFSGSTHDEYVKASTASYLADAKKTAVVTAAKAEAEAIEAIGTARAKAIDSQREAVDKSPEAAKLVYGLEMADKLGIRTIIKTITEAIVSGLRGGATS